MYLKCTSPPAAAAARPPPPRPPCVHSRPPLTASKSTEIKRRGKWQHVTKKVLTSAVTPYQHAQNCQSHTQGSPTTVTIYPLFSSEPKLTFLTSLQCNHVKAHNSPTHQSRDKKKITSLKWSHVIKNAKKAC